MESKIGRIKWRDIVKGFIVAMIFAIATAIYTAIQTSSFVLTWDFFKTVLLCGLGAGLSYLIKNLLTNSDDQFLKKEIQKKETFRKVDDDDLAK